MFNIFNFQKKNVDLSTFTKKEKYGLHGVHTLSVCDATSKNAQFLERKLEELRFMRQRLIISGQATEDALRRQWEAYKHYLALLNDNFLKFQVTVRNVTCTPGRSAIIGRFTGTTTYTGIVNYGMIGTNATAATIADTQLGTEVYRKALSSGTFSSNIGYLENFYTAAEVSGTFQEFGFVIDGTASANTGQLANHFNQTITKSVTETLNQQSIFTLSDV